MGDVWELNGVSLVHVFNMRIRNRVMKIQIRVAMLLISNGVPLPPGMPYLQAIIYLTNQPGRLMIG
jgi:hypothetical protein